MENLLKSAGLADENGKLKIPDGLKRLKIDVGLSVNAPQSQVWLENDEELLVIGVEPLVSNLQEIRSGKSEWNVKLNPELIGQRIFLLPVALSDYPDPDGLIFYVTKEDPGCSSLLKPKSFDILRTETVAVSTLNQILDQISLEHFPIIDHLKVDTQGSDFRILKGCSDFLDNIFAVTVELDTDEYEGTDNSLESVSNYLNKYGFKLFKPGLFANLMFILKGLKIDVETDDPTFINQNKIHLARTRKFFIYQRG